MIPSFDAIVVGGGIVGCACAYYLSQELERIALVEPGPIGGGATAAGMGHLVAMDDSEAQFALTSHSLGLWRELAAELPSGAQFDPAGTLWIASDEDEAGHLSAKRDFYRERGQKAEILDERQLREAEPNLREGLAGALLVPGDAVIYSPVAARFLFDQARAKGLARFELAAIEIVPGGVRLSDTSFLSSPIVVNAAGDLAGDLTPGLRIEPRKGHLAITDRYPGFVRHQLVEMGYLKSAHKMEAESVAFNLQPRTTGQILIGSSRQFVGWNPEVDRRVLSRMLERSFAFVSGMRGLNVIRTWTGFRAATPDKLPLIGPVQDGVWVAAGHEGLGITTSLATGKLIADRIAGRESAIDNAPYDPERFAHV